MQYEGLANYYDLLINDEEGQRRYASFVHSQLELRLRQSPTQTRVLELACGSGMLAHFLANKGYLVAASDVSSSMIAIAKQNISFLDPEQSSIDPQTQTTASKPHFFELDMCQFSFDQQYDAILCFCDSINYLLEESEVQSMFASVYASLKDNGVFLFDCHSMDRLDEFRSGYEEANGLDDLEYQWNIDTVGNQLHQHLQIWDDAYVPPLFVEEHHVQRVYTSEFIVSALQEAGFQDISVTTDFDLPGVVEGEKQFYCCRRNA